MNKTISELYLSNENEWRVLTQYKAYLPYDVIPYHSHVVLYGAGKNGKKIYEEIMRNQSWHVVGWIDKTPDSTIKEVKGLDYLNTIEFDHIYITIVNRDVQKQAIEELKKLGVESNKIVCYRRQETRNRIDEIFEEQYTKKKNAVYWHSTHEAYEMERPYSVTSMICNQSFFDAPFFQYWADKVHSNFCDLMRASGQLSEECLRNRVVYHRKLWEFVYIAQALYDNNMLANGKKGVVFGVGEECLPDLFASMGCEILATDLNINESSAKGWANTSENIAGDYWKLNQYGFCDEDLFKKMVTYRDVNMNNIPEDITGFDFCWSACALEHIGGIRSGLDFIKNSMNTLKAGGIAVHTTEYNIYSNDRTFESKELSLFRRRDIEGLIEELEDMGHKVYPMDWHIGENVADEFVDIPPYSKKDMHLRLKIQNFPSTSIGIIVRKG